MLTLVLVITLAACRDDENGGNFEANDQAIITCTEECAVHGQCGALPNDQRVVLASEGGPAVWLHNRFFIDGTLVNVLEISHRELIAARNRVPLIAEATPFPHVFYFVTGEDVGGTKTAWVSNWCLARP